MRKTITELLLKYDILQIVSMEESFFMHSTLAKDVKLSAELIQLNFVKLSPVPNPVVISYKEGEELYLWFVKQEKRDAKILLPESFLIYKALKEKQEGIFVFKTHPKRIYVLKERKLQAAFVSYETIDDLGIELIKDEYDLDNSAVYDAQMYDRLKQKALQELSVFELLNFIQIDLDKESLKTIFVEKLSYPLISLLVLYMTVTYLQGYFLEKRADALMQEYQKFKNQNSKTKSAIRKHNEEVEKLEDFFQKEFDPVDPFKVVFDLSKVVAPRDKATVTYLTITNGRIKIRIESDDDAIKYLKRFNAIPYLEEIVIENTFKPRNGHKMHTYTMKIKAAHE